MLTLQPTTTNKTIMIKRSIYLLVVALAAVTLLAQNSVTWDEQPEDLTVLVYLVEIVDGQETYTQLGEVADGSNVFLLPSLDPGTHTLVARNRSTDGAVSADSNRMQLTIPEAPKGFRFKITIEIEGLQ